MKQRKRNGMLSVLVVAIMMLGGGLGLGLPQKLGAQAAVEPVDSKLHALPIGSITPLGWLEDQLNLQKDGITGAMEAYPTYTAKNGWLGGDGDAWEKGPYYVRGLVALAYTLNDKELKSKSQKWIDWAIESQLPSGFFGPRNNSDWWARMPMLAAIRDYYDANLFLGYEDKRVMPFFEKYFRYQAAKLPNIPLSSWGSMRGADNIDIVLWYYDRVHDASNPSESAWLIELANLIESQSKTLNSKLPIITALNTTTVREHVVNTTQALKMGPLNYRLTGDEFDRQAMETALLSIAVDHGRADGMPNADEGPKDNKPTNGTELCAMVEAILSLGIASDVLGEVWIGDYLEKIAYNSLPTAYAPDYLGHVYYAAQNQVVATPGYHEHVDDHINDLTFGAPTGFECCFPNNHSAWPKFVQSMYKGTSDGGIAAVAYGPSKVTARVNGNKAAVFTQVTNYPFDETLVLNYSGETATFPLKLRVPEWAKGVTIKVNGVAKSDVAMGEFYAIDRQWTAQDSVEVAFEAQIETKGWYNNAVAVERGPLLYTLKIEEQWIDSDDFEMRGEKQEALGGMKFREVAPMSDWNYGLVIDDHNVQGSFTVVKKDMTQQPFETEGAPIVLKAKGQLIPEWQLVTNTVANLPYGYIERNDSLIRDIELIPYGSGRLRVTQFPRVGTQPSAIKHDAKKVSRYQDGAYVDTYHVSNIAVPDAKDYSIKVHYSGGGNMKFVLNSQMIDSALAFTQADNGTLVIDGVKSKINNEYFKFKSENINYIRFYGNDVTIDSVEVMCVDQTVDSANATAQGGELGFTVTLPSAGATPTYTVLYGTSPDKLDRTASGFRTNVAAISGVSEGTWHYQVVALINGKSTRSTINSVVVRGASGGGGETAAVAPDKTYRYDFASDLSGWTTYGTEGKITAANGRMEVQDDSNVKAVVDGAETFTDYTVSTKIRLVSNKDNNNAGLIFRVTEPSSGADAYRGYYFGIRKGSFMIGIGDNGYKEVVSVGHPIDLQTEYTLKVIVKGGNMAFFIDNRAVYTFFDRTFAAGTVGVRSYEMAFNIDDFELRALTTADEADLSAALDENLGGIEFTATRYNGLMQLRFYKAGVSGYKIVYGESEDKLDREIYDSKVFHNPDRVTVTGLDNAKTYYVKIIGIRNGMDVLETKPLALSPFDATDFAVRTLSILNVEDYQTLDIGARLELSVRFQPVKSQRDVTWKTSDPTVATVSADGVVTALKEGTVTITASAKTTNGDDTFQETTVTLQVKPAHSETADTPIDTAAVLIYVFGGLIAAGGLVCIYFLLIKKLIKTKKGETR